MVFRGPKTYEFITKTGFCDGFDKAFQNFNGLRPYPRLPVLGVPHNAVDPWVILAVPNGLFGWVSGREGAIAPH